MEEEDKPNTSVEVQDMDKGKALVASDTATVDREENQLLIVSPLTGLENCNIWEKLLDPDRQQWARPIPLAGLGDSGASPSTQKAIDDIMEVLRRGSINSIGVYGSDSITGDIMKAVSRQATFYKLFDVVVKATISHKPNNREIQDEIAKDLRLNLDDENKHVAKRSTGHRVAKAFGLKFDDEKKDVAERAKRLRDRILVKHKILVILCDLCKGLDLEEILKEIGIPFGADHRGCKLLLTSASEEVLSKEKRAQKVFTV